MKYFNSVLNHPAAERVGIISRFRSENRGWQYDPAIQII